MLIINGKIFTMTGKPVDCGYIRTEGKVITEVGTMSSLDKRQKGEGKGHSGQDGKRRDGALVDRKSNWRYKRGITI